MGSLILCHRKKARQPYEITRIHRKIYTMEELCYYLCNHLYLIDYTLANEQLCDWLEQELELRELAQNLRQSLQQHVSVEQFVLSILAYASIYTTEELKRIKNTLEVLKHQKPVERQKYKADNLLESGAVKSAILIYQSILHDGQDETMDQKFYGRVYACLGAAYGRMFLYQEAAKMYQTAFQICEEEAMLTAYMYACSCYMSEDEYQKLLKKSPVYAKADEKLKVVKESLEGGSLPPIDKQTLDMWKTQYRRLGTGEI